MYFWNINKLKSDFIEKKVTEKSTLHYLIAYTVLLCLNTMPYDNPNELDRFSAALMIPISILGILYAYSCNGGDKGENFLVKYFAIGWVVTIRLFIIFLPLMILLKILAGSSNAYISEGTSLGDVLIHVSLTALLFWRTGVHIRQIAEGGRVECEAAVESTS